ncbi:MAG TPA: GatB/YqeY domain-containing protein, partial [Paracoccaceae bacterium]
MELREKLGLALKEAMRSKAADRLSTLRLINAAIKDRDIEARSKGQDSVSDTEILAILAKMIRQREESAAIYEENGRIEMAEQERQEIEVIRGFLPEQLD